MLLDQIRQREFEELVSRARQIATPGKVPQRDRAEPIDPAQHLALAGEYQPHDPVRRAIPLTVAAAEITRALADPGADPDGSLHRTLTVQSLRELAVRLLIAELRGDLAAGTGYPRAISDLAVSLSLADAAVGLA
jgi:hypothetical protein